ncbi:MAG: hypothetical protein HZA78_08270 [Candidatus Schekmanbacteria bacterium]|nr:hypothetical protein [Candidatus Schekmanbacteria bacterium]
MGAVGGYYQNGPSFSFALGRGDARRNLGCVGNSFFQGQILGELSEQIMKRVLGETDSGRFFEQLSGSLIRHFRDISMASRCRSYCFRRSDSSNS